jgi:ribosomal protein S12 methylthiotransferase
MERVHLLSLGCPKNLVDSELMLGALTRAGFEVTLDPDQAHILIVNTCAFIESAKRESLEAILDAAEIKSRAAGRRLVVAGCMAQRYGAELEASLPEVDVLIGTGNFLDLPEILRRTQRPELRSVQYAGAAHLLPDSSAPRVGSGTPFSTYLKISEGCNHKCAFCIIPKIRGLHESRPLEDLILEARALARDGVRELNLIAQDLTAYGRDLSPRSSLAELLRALNEIDGLEWIRLLYCYPNFVSDQLLNAVAELTKVVKYIDMPLQHGDDSILRAMRRERSADALRRLVDRVRDRIPQVALRTSFIVGFPGETEAAFGRLKDFVEEQRFDRVGVFTYSQEENTAAFRMDEQIPSKVKHARRRELMALQAEISLKKNQALVGQRMKALIESESPEHNRPGRGRLATQAPEIDGSVLLGGQATAGEIVDVLITKALTYDLKAQIVGEPNRADVLNSKGVSFT